MKPGQWSPDTLGAFGYCEMRTRISLFPDVYRKLEWANLEVIINGNCTVDVFNIASGSKEHLEFNDKIVTASLTWNHLVIITATQMYIFKYVSNTTKRKYINNSSHVMVRPADPDLVISSIERYSGGYVQYTYIVWCSGCGIAWCISAWWVWYHMVYVHIIAWWVCL